MKYAALLLVSVFVLPVSADSLQEQGVIAQKSKHSVIATLDKLEGIVKAKGFTVFARIDHAAGASKVGQSLRPTQVLLFGNPKIGTALMSSAQSSALDLPIRVAAWEDSTGQVWNAYNSPQWLADRYAISDREKVIKKMTGALGKLTGAAAN
jgi:uncharacterized protein (DUF302 family)